MADRYWNKQNASTNWNSTAPTNWGSASNTADGASAPGSSDDVKLDGVGGGANDSNIQSVMSIRSLDCTGYTNTLTHNLLTSLIITGSGVDFILSPGMVYTKVNSASSQVIFTGTSGTTRVTLNGKVLGSTNVNGVGGTVQFQDAFASTGALVVTNGSLDTNDQNVDLLAFTSSNTNVRSISLGSSVIQISSASNALLFTTSTNLTLNPGTSRIIFTANSGTQVIAAWGGMTFYDVWIHTTSAVTFRNNQSGTFHNYQIDAGRTVNNIAGITLTVDDLIAVGTSGNPITLQGNAPGDTWNIVKSSGTVVCDWLVLRDSHAAGGATFYAGANSVDNGGNTGWIFADPPSGTSTTNFFF